MNRLRKDSLTYLQTWNDNNDPEDRVPDETIRNIATALPIFLPAMARLCFLNEREEVRQLARRRTDLKRQLKRTKARLREDR